MLGKDGRLYDSTFDFDNDGKLNAYEYSVMDDVVLYLEMRQTKVMKRNWEMICMPQAWIR